MYKMLKTIMAKNHFTQHPDTSFVTCLNTAYFGIFLLKIGNYYLKQIYFFDNEWSFFTQKII
jgi:hypothetical protein